MPNPYVLLRVNCFSYSPYESSEAVRKRMPSFLSASAIQLARCCYSGASFLSLADAQLPALVLWPQLNSEVPVPKPGKGEVLVRVRAASVNPADYHLQSGRLRPFVPARLPFTPGQSVHRRTMMRARKWRVATVPCLCTANHGAASSPDAIRPCIR